MRSTPVIVFINKLDRPSKEPFDLLDEVEKELHIRVRPLAFPISNGPTFKGVYNLYEKNLSLFTSDEKLTADASTVEISDLASPELDQRIGAKYADQLRQDVELVEHGFRPGVELHVFLRVQEVQDFELDRPLPAAVQVLFLLRFNDPDEELAVGVLRDFVDVDLPVRPHGGQLPRDRFDEVIQGHARSPSFTRISWWVA